jgi:hypothetical protein
MKIRNGFVSNSSSASFIVTIFDTTIDEVCSNISEHFMYNHFSKTALIEKIKNQINNYNKNHELLNDYNNYWIEKVRNYEEILNIIKQDINKNNTSTFESLNENLALRVLKEFYGVIVLQDENKVILSTFTSMYNDITEIPEILKDIVVYYNFVNNKKITCEIEND